MNLISRLFKRPCKHDWQNAVIHQVRVEDGRLVPFMAETPYLKECSKCHKTKRTGLPLPYLGPTSFEIQDAFRPPVNINPFGTGFKSPFN
jgi:hypothetical protein